MKKIFILIFMIFMLCGCEDANKVELTKDNWPSNIPTFNNFSKAVQEENEITIYKVSYEEATNYIASLKNTYPEVMISSSIYFKGSNDKYLLTADYDKKDKKLEIEIDLLNQR